MWYAVSSGNGNNGVSQLFPDYYVNLANADEAWRLAKLAAISDFKPGAGQAWCKRHLDIDGESKFTIYATLSDPPCEDAADGEYPDLPEGVEWEDAEDGRNWSQYNGFWKSWQIFPVFVPDMRRDRPTYDSLADAFGELASAETA